jgi:hypothetical protein
LAELLPTALVLPDVPVAPVWLVLAPLPPLDVVAGVVLWSVLLAGALGFCVLFMLAVPLSPDCVVAVVPACEPGCDDCAALPAVPAVWAAAKPRASNNAGESNHFLCM